MAPLTLEQILHFLHEAYPFGDLDAARVPELLGVMQIQRLRQGQYVYRAGDAPDAWYVLYEGSVEVLEDRGFGSTRIATVGPGGGFGARRGRFVPHASVRALTEATAFRFPCVELDAVLEDDPPSAGASTR